MSVAQEVPTPSASQPPSSNEKHLSGADGAHDALDNHSENASSSRKAGSIFTIVGSAFANFSDGYQQNLASSTNVIFNHLIGTHVYTSAKQTRISNALLVGSVIGIVVFGFLADKFSRKGGSK